MDLGGWLNRQVRWPGAFKELTGLWPARLLSSGFLELKSSYKSTQSKMPQEVVCQNFEQNGHFIEKGLWNAAAVSWPLQSSILLNSCVNSCSIVKQIFKKKTINLRKMDSLTPKFRNYILYEVRYITYINKYHRKW